MESWIIDLGGCLGGGMIDVGGEERREKRTSGQKIYNR
jgi:hypothetical protein